MLQTFGIKKTDDNGNPIIRYFQFTRRKFNVPGWSITTPEEAVTNLDFMRFLAERPSVFVIIKEVSEDDYKRFHGIQEFEQTARQEPPIQEPVKNTPREWTIEEARAEWERLFGRRPGNRSLQTLVTDINKSN